MVRGRVMTWGRVSKSAQAVVAHGLLFIFTLLLVLKLDRTVFYSWWIIFSPLWLFHAVVARCRFSLPAPSQPHDRHWAPCHAIVATPLLVAFELLLCIYLDSIYAHGYPAVNLKIVFLPLLAFEVIILVDNFRMCRALIPGDEESISDEVIWETLPVNGCDDPIEMSFALNLLSTTSSFYLTILLCLEVGPTRGLQFTSCAICERYLLAERDPHFWVAISMVFLIAATTFSLLKLCGDVGSVSWWDLFINFGIAECFAFLVCTKWFNPVIHRQSTLREPGSSSTTVRYLDWNSGQVVSSDDDQHRGSFCIPQNIGGHIMKIPVVAFQILLCMRLEGTPSNARHIPLPVLFAPLFLLQCAGVLFAVSRLVEKLFVILRTGAGTGTFFTGSSRAHECFDFLHRGSRFLGWWSIDEGSKEELARLFYAGASGYNTFCGYPPETVKKMPKKDLAEEVWRLQAALGEQAEITKYSQEVYEKLQCEKVLCRICFEGEISVVLLPCRHRILCSACSERCKKCPICRVFIDEHLPVYDA